jgi:hypothetical protein
MVLWDEQGGNNNFGGCHLVGWAVGVELVLQPPTQEQEQINTYNDGTIQERAGRRDRNDMVRPHQRTTGENCPCVGLRFKQGETLQRYTSEIVLTDLGLFYTNLRGAEWLSEISNALSDYAAQQYPKEFEPIKP